MENEKMRGLRRSRTETVAKKQASIARQHGLPAAELGFYKKHHAVDCGTPNCPACGNPRRTAAGTKTIHEVSSEEAFGKIELAELAV